MSISGAGVGDGQGQGDAVSAHQNMRDNTAGTEVRSATVVGALIGVSISVVSAVVLVVLIGSWLSGWAMALRRLLGYP